MYCRNCGAGMQDMAAVCTQCGCQKGMGSNYCPNCGKPIIPSAAVCLNCGVLLTAQMQYDSDHQKSKLAAGLLGIFLGWLGIHNFYLGYTKKAVLQLILGTIGWLFVVPGFVAWVWGIVEGIMILTGSKEKDAKGIPLKE